MSFTLSRPLRPDPRTVFAVPSTLPAPCFPILVAVLRFEPDDLGEGLMVLDKAGFVTTIDYVDAEWDAIWVVASAPSNLRQNEFLDHVYDIVVRCGGWVAAAETSVSPATLLAVAANHGAHSVQMEDG